MVSELGVLSTKIIDMRNEEVTIPNAVLVASPIKNYTGAFGERGALISTTVTIGDYASRVVSDYASRASKAEAAETSAETLTSSLSDTIASQSGVNIDEETAKLSDYQALYSAAAQIIQAANEMFEALLAAAKSA